MEIYDALEDFNFMNRLEIKFIILYEITYDK